MNAQVSRIKELLAHLGLRRSSTMSRASLRRNSTRAQSGAAAASGAAGSGSPAANHYDVLIVGGGNSCGYVCKELVDMQWGGKLGIVSSELVAPYERPALTKAFLHPPGAKVRARLPGFHTSVGGGGDRQTVEWYADKGIALMLGTTATALDLADKTLTVAGADGAPEELTYGKLVLATGAKALTPADIRMENPYLGNVFSIREEKEALAMVSALEALDGGEVVIVGGGYIGMETAAAFVGWGFNVTIVFPEDTIMTRLFPKRVAKVFMNYFEAKGVKMCSGSSVKGLAPNADDASVVGGVKLGSGEVLPADAVIFGVGARVNASLGQGELDAGEGRLGGYAVEGDSFLTSDPSVYAIGDIAAIDGKKRFEHVDFCRKSAAQAARDIAGKPSTFEYLPYFYSRVFEYTDTPLIFQFYGDSDTSAGQSVETFGDLDGALKTPGSASVPEFGAAWIDPATKVIKGVMLCNASQERYAAARDAVLAANTTFSDSFMA